MVHVRERLFSDLLGRGSGSNRARIVVRSRSRVWRSLSGKVRPRGLIRGDVRLTLAGRRGLRSA